jgi:hypothetical protein
MPRILADNNVEGHLDAIDQFLRSGTWQEFWEEADVTVVGFRGLGLEPDSPDRVVWQTCQSQEVVLFTGNRNQEGPDSLEETIRLFNQADSLPVITLGDPDRFGRERTYAENAAVKLLEYLLYLDQYRGAGRLYVP